MALIKRMVCRRKGAGLKLSETVKFSAKLSSLLVLALQTVKRTDRLGGVNSGGKVLFNVIQSKKTIRQPKPQALREIEVLLEGAGGWGNGGCVPPLCDAGQRCARPRRSSALPLGRAPLDGGVRCVAAGWLR